MCPRNVFILYRQLNDDKLQTSKVLAEIEDRGETGILHGSFSVKGAGAGVCVCVCVCVCMCVCVCEIMKRSFAVSCFEISSCDKSVIIIIINLLKLTGHVMHQQFNIQQLYVLPTLYLCVLYLSENKQRLVPLTA